MPGLDLGHLGNLIFSARKRCGLTQKELAKQTGLSVKTIQDAEKGRKRPNYETLTRLTERLGIPPDNLFQTKEMFSADEVQQLLDIFNSFDSKSQGILLKTMHFLAEQLRTLQEEPEE